MSAITILFYLFMVMAAVAASAIVFSRNVFKSALYLLVCLLSIAALYVLAFAEFLAVAQILIYAGGILVIIIFGIMLTTKISGHALVVKNNHMMSGIVAGVGLLAILARFLPSAAFASPKPVMREHIAVIGLEIFGSHSLAFEIAGLLLLIALIGAAIITTHSKSRT